MKKILNQDKFLTLFLGFILLLFFSEVQAATLQLNSTGGKCPSTGTTGGLNTYVGSNGQFQVERCSADGVTSNTRQFYSVGATPSSTSIFNSVYLRVGSSIVGAYTDSPFLATQTWTEVSSTGGSTTGDGTVITVYSALVSGQTYTVTQTTSYLFPNDFYTVHYHLDVPAGNTQKVRLYHWTDLQLDGDDNGQCTPQTSFPQFVGGQNTAKTFIVGYRQRGIGDIWSRHYCGVYSNPPTQIVATSGDLGNTDTLTNHDMGAAIQWDVVAVSGSASFDTEFDMVFSINKPTLTKYFGPNDGNPDHTVNTAEATTLTFTINNVPALPAQAGMAFTNTLPTGVNLTSIASNGCGGTVTTGTSSGRGTITLANGILSGGIQSCTIVANVVAPVAGVYNNPATDVTSTSNINNLAEAALTVISSPKDYADAPATYGTPSHIIVATLKLGTTAPDSETAAQPSTAANLDDTTGTDDEDAIASFPTLTSGVTAYSLSNIPVTNTTGSAATLYGWIDVNLNGRFDGNEVATAAVASGATTATLNWSGLNGVTAGSSYVRLRLTTQALTNTNSSTLTSQDTRSDGTASDGEVEDYALTVAAAPITQACSGYTTTIFDPNTTLTDTGYDGFNTTPSNSVGTFAYSEFANTAQHLSIKVMDWGNATLMTDGSGDDAGYTGTSINNADWDRAAEFTRTIQPSEAGTYSVKLVYGDDHVFIFRNGVQVYAQANAYSVIPVTLPNLTLAAGDILTVRLVEEHSFNTALNLEIEPLFTSNCAQTATPSNDQMAYANTGTGAYKNEIAWLNWSNSSLADGIQAGDQVTFPLACGSGSLTATVSNVVNPTGAVKYIPVDMNTWSGASLYQSYNTPLTGEALYNQSNTQQDIAFTLTFDMTVGGNSIAPDLIFADAEATSDFQVPPEFLTVTTNGGAWNLIENAIGSDYDISGVGTSSIIISDTEQPSNSPVLLTKNATELRVSIDAYGKQGIALGVLLPCDRGDASGYGDPEHLFLMEASNPSGSPASPAGLKNVPNQLHLGTAEPDAETAITADDNLQGLRPADEDGVTIPTLTQGSAVTMTATVAGTGGYLQGWIDWNGNSVFDAAEKIAVDLTDGGVTDTNPAAGIIGWTVNVPADAVTTPTFARFRWSTTAGLDATTAASDGEVEDYAVTILPTSIDYGDAPSNLSSTDPALINIYNVLNANSAAKHTVNAAIRMGASIDGETDGQPNAAASGDGSDDDGVTFPTFPDGKSVLYVEQANTLTVNVSTAGYLNAWIDWNENGVWDASDNIASDKAVVAGNNTLTVTLPNTTTQGSKYARFRFCTTAGQCSSASGLASDGEVEDYKIDYVTLRDNGSCSALLNGDFEQGVTATNGVYDENTIPYWGTTPDMPSSGTFAQRNGIEIWKNGFLSTPSQSGNFLAEINAYVNGTLYQDVALTPGTTVSWSLWHRGRDGVDSMNVLIGTPDDVQQRLASTVQKLISDNNTKWVFYSGTYQVPVGQYVTRFGFHSISTSGSDATVGNLVDNISLGVTCRDYGDAPAQYPTTNANNGAYHQLSDTQALYIGSTPDKELEGMPGNTASGDDTSGSDDEDGVSTLPTLTTNDSSYSLSVKVTNTSTKIANLVGWIDFNRNDSFDSNEAATTTVAAGTSNSNVRLAWTGLSGGVAGNSYLRLRLTTDTNVATGNASTSLPTGVAGDGEIEDYLLDIAQSGYKISGRVFNDANVNTLDNTEQGIKAVTIVLQDVAAGTCLSTKTGADGSYTFSSVQPAAANNYVLYEAANEKTATPDACPPAANDPNGYLSTTPNSLTVTVSNADVTGQNFGDIKNPTLTLDNETVILPNTSVVYPHIFRSTADGSVAFNLVNEIAEPAGSSWGSTLYLDANCNAKLDSSDTPITAPLSVSGTEKTCLLVKVIAPANVSAGASHSIQVQSTFTFGDGTVVTAADVQTRTDLTRVSSGSATSPLSGAGKLSLEKSVWNTTRNIDGAVALPGETLRYTIHYENIGDGTLDELAVHDSVPAFTTLVDGSLQCVSTPTELSVCSPSSSAGSLDWSFTGKLQAGSQGAVAYDVMVE